MLTADTEEVERHFVDIVMGKEFGDIYFGVQSASLCKAEAHLSLSPIRWAGNETLIILLRFCVPYKFPSFFCHPRTSKHHDYLKTKSWTE